MLCKNENTGAVNEMLDGEALLYVLYVNRASPDIADSESFLRAKLRSHRICAILKYLSPFGIFFVLFGFYFYFYIFGRWDPGLGL